jgi:hypothetical protein
MAVVAITAISLVISVIGQWHTDPTSSASEMIGVRVTTMRHALYLVLALPWLYLLFEHPSHAVFLWIALIAGEHLILVAWFKSRTRKG